MKLSEAVSMLKEDIDRFEKHYQEGMDTTDYYLEELPEEDWFDQFLCFLSLEEEK